MKVLLISLVFYGTCSCRSVHKSVEEVHVPKENLADLLLPIRNRAVIDRDDENLHNILEVLPLDKLADNHKGTSKKWDKLKDLIEARKTDMGELKRKTPLAIILATTKLTDFNKNYYGKSEATEKHSDAVHETDDKFIIITDNDFEDSTNVNNSTASISQENSNNIYEETGNIIGLEEIRDHHNMKVNDIKTSEDHSYENKDGNDVEKLKHAGNKHERLGHKKEDSPIYNFTILVDRDKFKPVQVNTHEKSSNFEENSGSTTTGDVLMRPTDVVDVETGVMNIEENSIEILVHDERNDFKIGRHGSDNNNEKENENDINNNSVNGRDNTAEENKDGHPSVHYNKVTEELNHAIETETTVHKTEGKINYITESTSDISKKHSPIKTDDVVIEFIPINSERTMNNDFASKNEYVAINNNDFISVEKLSVDDINVSETEADEEYSDTLENGSAEIGYRSSIFGDKISVTEDKALIEDETSDIEEILGETRRSLNTIKDKYRTRDYRKHLVKANIKDSEETKKKKHRKSPLDLVELGKIAFGIDKHTKVNKDQSDYEDDSRYITDNSFDVDTSTVGRKLINLIISSEELDQKNAGKYHIEDENTSRRNREPHKSYRLQFSFNR